MLILSREDECQKVALSTCEAFRDLLSNQEEADTKVIVHAVHALQQQTITEAVNKSASGDTEIIILSISLLSTYKENVFLENGSRTYNVLYWLGNFDLLPQKCLPLIGLHAFTGSNYVSSFFRKEKNGYWKLVQKYNVGSPALAEETINPIEEYVCYL